MIFEGPTHSNSGCSMICFGTYRKEVAACKYRDSLVGGDIKQRLCFVSRHLSEVRDTFSDGMELSVTGTEIFLTYIFLNFKWGPFKNHLTLCPSY